MDDARLDRLRRAAVRGGTLARWRSRRAVRALTRLDTPAAARCLAEVLVASTDDAVTGIAAQALAALTDQAARDAVCELAVTTPDRRLATLIHTAGYLPSDPQRRALWLFLDGQFERAAELDFDGGLLRAAHRTADAELRGRIAAKARTAGRVEWLHAVVHDRPARLAELTEQEWDTTLHVLSSAQRWDELWQLTGNAPLPSAARILHTLGRHGWRPETDTEAFAHLVALAERCVTPPSTAALFRSVRRLMGSSQGIHSSLTVSQRGDLLTWTSRDGAARLWHLPSGEDAGTVPRQLFGSEIAISPDGSTVAFADNPSRRMALWSVSAASISASWSTGASLKHLAIAPDGLVVGTDLHGRVSVWQPPSGQRLWTLRAQGSHGYDLGVRHLLVTPDARLLITTGPARGVRRRATVCLWELPSGRPAGVVDRRFSKAPRLLVTPDSRRLVTIGSDDAQIWELPSLTLVAHLDAPSGGLSGALSFDGRLLTSVCRRGDIEVRRTADGEVVNRIHSAELAALDRTYSWPTVAMSPDGRLVLAGDRLDPTVYAWHLPSGEPAGTLSGTVDGDTIDGDTIDGDTGDSHDGPRSFIFGGFRDDRTLRFASDGSAVAHLAWPEFEWGGQVVMWRSEPALLGYQPVGAVSHAEVARLRRHKLTGGDRTWVELLDALVRWRYRHDIDVTDPVPAAPARTDIEASG